MLKIVIVVIVLAASAGVAGKRIWDMWHGNSKCASCDRNCPFNQELDFKIDEEKESCSLDKYADTVIIDKEK